MNGNRMRTLGVGGQQLLDYLNRMQAENPAFVYAIQTGSDHSSLGNIFWADATAKINYAHFGDTVTFDTSSRTNRFRVPFVSFTGLNHHGQPVLFGCALMVNESENSFVWLFQVWLHAMSGRCPVSITTDPDGLIQSAVAQVFPQTRHRFCKRRILREIQEKLGHIYQAHPTFETELNMCINETETIDEFESSWQSLQHRYYLLDNEWLMNMYSVRQQWVPAYMRNTFFGELSATDDSECLDSFFSSFINASTTIQTLIKQYEKAVSSWHEKELDADYDTINTIPVLKTPSPMEKQAANLYTRRIFMKFQDELVETLAISATRIDESGTITTYRVAKYGEEHKAHTVTFDSFEMKADCSCQMFEYSGVICRHILAVFRAKNVLMLPPQYVLKRWTRDAKSGAAEVEESTSELPVVTQETLSIRYNNLRQEAIKYVEEGAKSIQNYNVAMAALQEAAKKVAAVKAQHSGARQDGCMTNGGSQEVHFAEENDSSLQSTAAKDAKIREMTAELESVNQHCEMYRANLFAILRDMEEQKSKLLVKVQNAKLSL